MQNRIDEVLKEQGKTYKDLVALTGMSEYGIGEMAQGSSDETLGAWLSVARAMNVSPAYLVGWSDEPSEDEHKYDIESSDVFKAYMSKVEPEPYYDFAKSKPTSGVKVTLDDGRVIYDSRELEDMDAYSLAGDWVCLNGCKIAKNHIVSIEKVGAES
jgi:transcriptional regulator with XRE-family HTH domain